MTDLSMYGKFSSATGAPILANITEFGSTPLYTTEELASVEAQLAEAVGVMDEAKSLGLKSIEELIRDSAPIIEDTPFLEEGKEP